MSTTTVHALTRTVKGRAALKAAMDYGRTTGFVTTPFLKTILKSMGITYREFKDYADRLGRAEADAAK